MLGAWSGGRCGRSLVALALLAAVSAKGIRLSATASPNLAPAGSAAGYPSAPGLSSEAPAGSNEVAAYESWDAARCGGMDELLLVEKQRNPERGNGFGWLLTYIAKVVSLTF